MNSHHFHQVEEINLERRDLDCDGENLAVLEMEILHGDGSFEELTFYSLNDEQIELAETTVVEVPNVDVDRIRAICKSAISSADYKAPEQKSYFSDWLIEEIESILEALGPA